MSSSYTKTILITGGAGFIGSHVVRLFVTKYPHYKIVNLDALTYAGNLENLKDIEEASNYVFERADILDVKELDRIFSTYQPDGIIHLAAESHVDRSILSPHIAPYNSFGIHPRLHASTIRYFAGTSQ